MHATGLRVYENGHINRTVSWPKKILYSIINKYLCPYMTRILIHILLAVVLSLVVLNR